MVRGYTAYQVPAHKTRPEVPPIIVTWADRAYLAAFAADIAALRQKADIVVPSCHWGLGEEVLDGLGSFSFHTGHGGRRHGDWIGMMARVELTPGGGVETRFRFVRHNAANETVACALAAEGPALDRIVARSAALDAGLMPEGDWIRVTL